MILSLQVPRDMKSIGAGPLKAEAKGYPWRSYTGCFLRLDQKVSDRSYRRIHFWQLSWMPRTL